ncbi:MarR family transcriptional regulator [Clostridium sp. 19966]|uniref:MarR family winged helix-turn-helix transcriptional regulator n=1 Tax=Clostridium sp. 19966 TaxID=2768166 RepID=UPI0028E05D02|nr:MarR family transcriptional regulator [Clostridium sp. 19966]MDT8717240.1 MarR family transcriptional regulator [Clostridium sp. 19966]
MDNFDILKLDNQLCFSAYAFSRAIIKAYRPFLDELNITYPQYLVMLVLWEHEKITLKDMGHKLHLDSGTLTPLLKKLEAAGLIIRERSKEDERLLWITITPKGMNLREKALSIPENIIKATNANLQELYDLKIRLDKIFKNLDLDNTCQ